jgi:hypothetical protein
MRRLPGPAGCRLGDGVKTPEAPFGLFRDWQRTPTQSSVRTLRSLRLQMDVRFCEMQEPPAERHCCVTTDSDSSQMRALPSAPGDLVFPLDNSTTWMSAIRKFRGFALCCRVAAHVCPTSSASAEGWRPTDSRTDLSLELNPVEYSEAHGLRSKRLTVSKIPEFELIVEARALTL